MSITEIANFGILIGDGAADTLEFIGSGPGSAAVIFAGASDNNVTMIGSGGSMDFIAGPGDDTMIGHGLLNEYFGGPGNDTFVFTHQPKHAINHVYGWHEGDHAVVQHHTHIHYDHFGGSELVRHGHVIAEVDAILHTSDLLFV